jgi:hypothetical protein
MNDFADLFPEDACLEISAELSVWTSIDDCLAAARFLEGRTQPTDTLSRQLIVPFLDDQDFETVFVQCLDWLIRSYRVPPMHVRLAALLDRDIAPETCTMLLESRFKPRIDAGPAGVIGMMFPPLSHHENDRFFVIEDEPHVIELVQNPVRCVLNMLSRAWPTAARSRALREESKRESGEAPTIFHQPYADGPLFALIEALVFYSNGLAIGPNAIPATHGVNRGYRSVEVVGRPPIEPELLAVAQELEKEMFRSLE